MPDKSPGLGSISRRDFLKLSGLAAGAVVRPSPTPARASEASGGESIEQIRAQAEAAIEYLKANIVTDSNYLNFYFLRDIVTTQAKRGDLEGAIIIVQENRDPDFYEDSFYSKTLNRLAEIAVDQKKPRALEKLLEFEMEHERKDYDTLLDGYLYLAEAQAVAGSPGSDFSRTIGRIKEVRKEMQGGYGEDIEVDNRLNTADIRLSFRNGERPIEDALAYARGVAGNFLWSGGDWGYYGLSQGYFTIAQELILANREDLVGPLIEKVKKLNPGSDLASQRDMALFGVLNGLCDLGLTYWPKQLGETIEDINVRNELHRNIAVAIAKKA